MYLYIGRLLISKHLQCEKNVQYHVNMSVLCVDGSKTAYVFRTMDNVVQLYVLFS